VHGLEEKIRKCLGGRQLGPGDARAKPIIIIIKLRLLVDKTHHHHQAAATGRQNPSSSSSCGYWSTIDLVQLTITGQRRRDRRIDAREVYEIN